MINIKSFFGKEEEVLIIKVLYLRPEKLDNGKWTKGTLYITYRDSDGIKKVRKIEDPKTDIFFTKPEYRNSFRTQRRYLSEPQAERCTTEYRNIKKTIRNKIEEDGKDLEYLEIYNDNPKEIFKWRHSYFADYDLCDYVKMAYAISNIEPKKFTVSKAFFDIESDIYGRDSDDMNNGKCPINAISCVFTHDANLNKFEHPKVYTTLLRNEKYTEQEWLENHMDEFMERCNKEFKKYDEPKITIKFFDNEILLLRAMIGLIRHYTPDYCMIWNMSYDIPAIIKRLEYLGEDPRAYFTDKEFDDCYIRYNYDFKFASDFKNKSESFDCTMKTEFTDQMLNYAAMRKAKGDYGGNSLDNIANIELGAEKRRFDNPKTDVKNAPYLEYANFVLYSINDVLLQYGIDKKTDDLDQMVAQSYECGTRFHKIFKQSIYLKNLFSISYFKNENIIPGNNINVNYNVNSSEDAATDSDIGSEEEMVGSKGYDADTKLVGALVGNPQLNDYMGAMIHDMRSKYFFVNVADFDFSSMYPYIKYTANIGITSQVGRIIIKDQLHPLENLTGEKTFMRGGYLLDIYEQNDMSKVGNCVGLHSIDEYISEFDERCE